MSVGDKKLVGKISLPYNIVNNMIKGCCKNSNSIWSLLFFRLWKNKGKMHEAYQIKGGEKWN
ncbi:hypothetical protein HGP05_06625 [Streptococcus sanguinis]|uniref:Uncharacterized protein n=1 Tax=Streptococcus sanguinis TaxID=1305 RepID=A0A7Y0VBH8_STRSA|nr:hypothetical protein [Streptococcus sanguinis]